MKFRIFDELNHKYVTQIPKLVQNNGIFCIPETERYRAELSTGMFDVNGKEIFENDIVGTNVLENFVVKRHGDGLFYVECFSDVQESLLSLVETKGVKVLSTVHDEVKQEKE